MKGTIPHRVLRRGEADRKALVEALDGLGIGAGEDFVVAAAPEGEAFSLKFTKGSATSRQAALQNYPRAGSQRREVLLTINGGMTRSEIAQQTGLLDSSVDARVIELVDGGFVSPSGMVRKTSTGCDAEILILTPKGRDAVREGG